MDKYRFADGAFSFEGAISVLRQNDLATPWRIDASRAKLYPFVREKAQAGAGVRLTMNTDTKHLELHIAPQDQRFRLDLCLDRQRIQEIVVEPNATTVQFQPLPPGRKLVEIWLDPRIPFGLRHLTVDPGATVSKVVDSRKRWIHYGSSISHAGAGRTPSQNWPALTATRANVHLTNLGFGGNCHLEPMIGRLIRDTAADFISMKLGINVQPGTLSQRTFSPNAIGLIALIREKHPETPLVIISPIFSAPREETRAFSHTLSLCEMRTQLASVVDSFHSYGDENIHYVDGLSILGPEGAKYMPDQLHPNADGQFVMADNFYRNVFQKYFDS